MRINYSRVAMFQRCPRFYHWRFILNLVPPKEPLPLLVGRAVHAGLAALYAKTKDPAEYLNKVFEDVIETGHWLGPELEELQKQQQYSRFILEGYQRQWPNEPFTVLAPEVEGSVELPASRHILQFRTDAVVSWKGRPWLLEHKTTAQLGPTFFRKFRMDGQITCYVYAVWRTLGERPVGAIINAIRKSRKLDSAEFARDVVMRSERQIHDFLQQFTRQVDAIEASDPAESEAWPQHTDACVQFNRGCPYLDLCSNDTPDMRALYVTRPPDYVDGEETQ